MRRVTLAALAGAALLVAACGGPKINYGKVNTAKRVALVGVCQPIEVFATRGTVSARADVGNGIIDPLAVGLSAALASSWAGVEVVPLAAVANNPAVPRRPQYDKRRCAMGFDPMLPKGYAGDADKAYMADLANKLGVDAVLAVSWQTGIRLNSEGLKVFSGTFNPVSYYLVDRTGEQIALVKSKGLDGDYVPMQPSEAAAYAPAALSFSRLAAQDFVAKLRDN